MYHTHPDLIYTLYITGRFGAMSVWFYFRIRVIHHNTRDNISIKDICAVLNSIFFSCCVFMSEALINGAGKVSSETSLRISFTIFNRTNDLMFELMLTPLHTSIAQIGPPHPFPCLTVFCDR